MRSSNLLLHTWLSGAYSDTSARRLTKPRHALPPPTLPSSCIYVCKYALAISPRTRACALCCKKRIKRDTTLPQCLLCIRIRRSCPGPLTRPLTVNMTAKARHGMQKRRRPNVVSKRWEDDLDLDLFATHISQRAALQEAFYAHFLA